MLNQSDLETDNTVTNVVTKELVQRINLVKFVSRQRKIYLPFVQILQICAGVLIVLLGYSICGFGARIIINRHIAKLEVQNAKLVEEIGSDQIKRMQELAGNDMVYTYLQAERLKNAPGFSNYLAAIAAACPRGVWLTSVEIKKFNNSVTLLGKAYYSNHILRFLGNLNRDSLFSGTPFYLAKIEKAAGPNITDNRNQLPQFVYNFTLQIKGGNE